MKLGRCPICHSNLHLEQVAQDEAARQLLALLAPLDGATGRAMIAYLGLFRPAKSDLSWKRSLKLAQEALSLSDNRDYLRTAMECTVQKLREARQSGTARPLSNHNYLRKVLAGLGAEDVVEVREGPKRKPMKAEIFNQGRPETAEESMEKWRQQMRAMGKEV